MNVAACGNAVAMRISKLPADCQPPS